MGVGINRLVGYKDAIRAHGGSVTESLIAYGDFSEASGTAAMRRLLEVSPDLDAVFVASDLMALGALRALREAGRRVPDDVAVVGFEDNEFARQSDPPLTTVYQPVEEMGRHMAHLLLSLIRRDELDLPYVLLDTHMVERASA
jgi:DNA-binding LacI/PurR family transcriptional regulator